MVAAFHSEGVKVLFGYNPWDVGTRREHCGDAGYACGAGIKYGEPMSDADALAALLIAVGADGFNGDTMGTVPAAYFDAGVARHHPLAMESEGAVSVAASQSATLGWGEE